MRLLNNHQEYWMVDYKR